MARSADDESSSVGRYILHDEIAAGGMATVHLARMRGAVGFGRIVAIKRLHAQYAKDPEFVSMFIDEARLAARIRHPNVVSTLDVVARGGELFVVMDYIHGASLASLWRDATSRGARIPPNVAVGVAVGVLQGLHAAHEARDERGEPLHVIHRDVSPQNVLVGTDGVARILDFGVARAAWRIHTTRDGQIKGKLRYMAPEQLRGGHVDRRADLFAASIVLWEMLTGKRLFEGDEPDVYVSLLLQAQLPRPRSIVPDLPPALEAVVMRGLSFDRDERYADARAMAIALEGTLAAATSREIGEWVDVTVGKALAVRAARVAALENLPMPGEAQDDDVPSAAALVDAAEARQARARMATEVSLPATPDPRTTSGAPSASAATAAAGGQSGQSARRRGMRVAMILAVALLGSGGWAAWAATHRGLPAKTGQQVRAAHEAAPSATPLEAASSSAPTISASITPPEAPTNPSPSAPATIRPRPFVSNRPRVPTATAATVAPTATTKGRACMKQRADGVVYFEPCP
jgi:serine/threonine-protein kinase